MSLTYQPFANAPEVQKIDADLRMNVADDERIISAAAGGGLILAALMRGGLGRLLLLGAGAALLRRAWTGHCPWYDYQRIDKRHGSRGVRGHRGTRIEQSVEVNCPPEVLYRQWRNLSDLAKILPHVESVEERANNTSHWKVKTRTGASLEWDAEIINDEEGRMIAWQTLPGAVVRSAGSVWFEPAASGVTRVKVALEFDPPVGRVGDTLAHLLGGSPEAELKADLERFKAFAESNLARPAA